MRAHGLVLSFVAISISLAILPTSAATGRLTMYPLAEMMRSGLIDDYKEHGIELYWADQLPTRAIEKEIEEDNFTRSANVFARSDKTGCRAAFEELLEKLIKEAESRGANALVGIRSFHDELPDYSSATDIRCDVGKFRAVVGFKFRFVKLAP